MRVLRLFLLTTILTFAVLPLAQSAAQQKAAPGALLFIGMWQRTVLVLDETQGRVVERIELQTGTPQSLTLSYDRKKIYATTWGNGVEVIDLATRKITNHFTLNEGPRTVRMRGFAPDPTDTLLYGTVATAIKKIDRFEIEKPKFAVIDLAQKKIVKTFDFPKEHDTPFGFRAGYRVSPDGKLLYVFREDVLIFDLKDFKQVDKIELSKPPHPGVFPVQIGGDDDLYDDPNILTSLFMATDPVVRKRIFGLARLDLNTRQLDFTPIGPATTGMTGLQVTPDRKTGYTIAFNGNGPTRRTEFWVFDVTARKLVRKQEIETRSRFNFSLSGDGRQLYIHGAGPTIECYDAATFKLQRVITLDGDSTTNLLVVRPTQ